jgi:hypothetical protein
MLPPTTTATRKTTTRTDPHPTAETSTTAKINTTTRKTTTNTKIKARIAVETTTAANTATAANTTAATTAAANTTAATTATKNTVKATTISETTKFHKRRRSIISSNTTNLQKIPTTVGRVKTAVSSEVGRMEGRNVHAKCKLLPQHLNKIHHQDEVPKKV